MRSSLSWMELGDEEANYTIGQLVTLMGLVDDFNEYEKVERVLRKREERVKEEARKEMGDVIGRFEVRYDEVMKWKVSVEESVEKLVDEVRVLRERINELWKGRKGEKVRVLELLKLTGTVEEGLVHLVKGSFSVEGIREDTEEGVAKLKKVNAYLVKDNVMLSNEFKGQKSLKPRAVEDVKAMEGVIKDLAEENVKLRMQAGLWREKVEALMVEDEVGRSRVKEMELKFKCEESLRMSAEKDFEASEVKSKEMAEENVKLREEVEAGREMIKELKKVEEAEKLRVKKLESLRVRVEKNFEILESKNKDLMKEKVKLRKEARVWRDVNEELKKEQEVEKLRVKELEIKFEGAESLRVRAEEGLEALERKFKGLADENLKLLKEVRVWRGMDEDLRKQNEDAEVRVLELETKAEVEGSLRLRLEEELEALEYEFKALERRVLITEKDTEILLTSSGLDDSSQMKKVARKPNPTEAAGCCQRSSVAGLTDGAHLSNTEAENVEATVNRREVDHARHAPAAIIHISSDSDDEAPTRFERKRPRNDMCGKVMNGSSFIQAKLSKANQFAKRNNNLPDTYLFNFSDEE